MNISPNRFAIWGKTLRETRRYNTFPRTKDAPQRRIVVRPMSVDWTCRVCCQSANNHTKPRRNLRRETLREYIWPAETSSSVGTSSPWPPGVAYRLHWKEERRTKCQPREQPPDSIARLVGRPVGRSDGRWRTSGRRARERQSEAPRRDRLTFNNNPNHRLGAISIRDSRQSSADVLITASIFISPVSPRIV